ncbi:helix-turn-helix domain-containing protein [Amycolatopsis sp. NPDC049253]|uniref:TetR/AcrR family transcriptional regulator n=1 Tax=Amycolatopsis sp. NPDC049253 TaxID=3155274 RepID=UPI003436D82B
MDTGRKLLPRAERRAQILAAARTAFARDGYAATTIELVARESGVTATIIYRHFAGKPDLYRAVLDDVRDRLRAATSGGTDLVRAAVAAAAADPDGFRLLFRHVAREPEFASWAADFRSRSSLVAESALPGEIPDPARRAWAATLLTTLSVETILTWLDADRPASEETVATAIDAASAALITAIGAP